MIYMHGVYFFRVLGHSSCLRSITT